MDKDKTNPVAIILGVVLAVVLIVIAAIGGLALVSIVWMWAWSMFMVPVFALPLLSFQEAFGSMVMLVIVGSAFRASVRKIGKS